MTPGPDGRLRLDGTVPEQVRVWAGQMALLFPIYHGRLPWAAAQLDQVIRQDSVFIADPGGRANHASTASTAARLNADRHTHERGSPCPRITCTDAGHDQEEHLVWLHTHQLHSAGLLVIDDTGTVHHARPPQRPGDSWHLIQHQPGIS
jgi:hypothetical protein